MNGLSGYEEVYILLQNDCGDLSPHPLIDGSLSQRLFAERVARLRPLCIRTAVQYPGLLSVEDPQKVCTGCELRECCGSVCVQTLGVKDTRVDRKYVVMHFQNHREKTPDEEKRSLRQLLMAVTGHAVAC